MCACHSTFFFVLPLALWAFDSLHCNSLSLPVGAHILYGCRGCRAPEFGVLVIIGGLHSLRFDGEEGFGWSFRQKRKSPCVTFFPFPCDDVCESHSRFKRDGVILTFDVWGLRVFGNGEIWVFLE